MIKNIEEKNECLYCIYCASKLKRVSLNVKICPKDCVEITFMKPKEAIEEMFRERKESKRDSGPTCGCHYPMIS